MNLHSFHINKNNLNSQSIESVVAAIWHTSRGLLCCSRESLIQCIERKNRIETHLRTHNLSNDLMMRTQIRNTYECMTSPLNLSPQHYALLVLGIENYFCFHIILLNWQLTQFRWNFQHGVCEWSIQSALSFVQNYIDQ